MAFFASCLFVLSGFSDGESPNLVANGSFEGGDDTKLGPYSSGRFYDGFPGGWGGVVSGVFAGWVKKGPWLSVDPYDADGRASGTAHAAALQKDGVISNRFSVAACGTYEIKFSYVRRGSSFVGQRLDCLVDDDAVLSVASVQNSGWMTAVATNELTEGLHWLKIVGSQTSPNADQCSAVDMVSVRLVKAYDDRVAVMSNLGSIGTPTPGYGVLSGLKEGDERTFTAPAGIDTGDYTAICSGWKLYRYNGESNEWELSAQSDDSNKTRCDYMHGTAQARLVWLWDCRVSVDTSTAGSGSGSVWVSANSAVVGSLLTCAAVPDGSSVFDHWEGDVPAGSERNPTLSLSVGYASIFLTAHFSAVDGSASDIEYVGANDGAWDVASNWRPEKVPTALDSVTIDGKRVVCAGALAARSVTVAGSEGSLVVGDGIARLSVLVGGDFKVLNGAKVRFCAGRTAGVVATNWMGSAALLYSEANAAAVRVGGLLRIGAGSTLYAQNDALTGTPVFFRPRNFEVESEGAVDAVGLGFALFKKTDWSSIGGAPVGAAYSTANHLSSTVETGWYSYGFGRGCSYRLGGGHGGVGKNETTSYQLGVNIVTTEYGGTEAATFYFGGAYGYPLAPFLPGSSNGAYRDDTPRRGGGTICVFTTERAKVDGIVRADAFGWDEKCSGGPSGGSIWITAKVLAIGRTAVLTARGGNSSGNSTGAGGRIALAAGASQSELDDFAAGQTPDGFTITNIIEVASNVNGGNDNEYNNAGTAVFAFAGSRVLPALVTAGGTEAAIVNPAYGFNVFDRMNMPEFSCASGYSAVYDAACRNRRRSIPSGSVVFEDATGAIPSLEDAVGTVKAVWTGVDEDSLRLMIVGGGTVTVNGVSYASDAEIWLPEGEGAAVLAAADGTGRFVRFVGDIPGGASNARTISVPVVPGMIVQAVFSDAVAVEKTFVGGDGAFWDADESWSPVGIPSAVDNVSVAGKVRCCNVLAAGSLSVTGGKVLVGGDVDGNKFHSGSTAFGDYVAGIGLSVAGNVEIGDDDGKIGVIVLGARLGTVKPYDAEIGGSLTLSGASEMTVHACPYPEDQYVGNRPVLTNFYHTAYKVKIGCELTLSDSSQLIPDCDILTGNPVCFDVGGNVTIGEAAKVNARMRGFGWVENEGTWSTTSGWTYMRGGVYAGLYAKSGNSPFYTDAATCLYAAPYVPGAPCGQYSDYTKLTRGGGVVWIKTSRRIVLDGMIDASGGNRLVDVPGELSGTEGGSSGGGIWLVCSKLAAGPHAAAYSYGGCCNNKDSTFGGSGGSVCVSMKVSDRNLALFAEGATDVRGCAVKSGVAFSTDVTGHSNASGEAPPGPSGSATTVTGVDSKLSISIR